LSLKILQAGITSGLITHFESDSVALHKIPEPHASSSISKFAGGLFSTTLSSKTVFTAGSASLVFTAPIAKAPVGCGKSFCQSRATYEF
jgi:hypothetical protein